MSEESLVEPQVEEETKESGELPPTQSAPTEPQTPTEKPEYIPKKFWDNGKVQTEDLAKSYTELESKIGQKKEGFKDEFISEFKAEQQKLGDNADARIGSVSNWAAKNFKDGELDIVVQLGTTADGIRFLERVIGMGVSSVNSADSVDKGTGKLTLADLRSKMQDPRYWDQNQRDESFVREVEQDFQKLGGH